MDDPTESTTFGISSAPVEKPAAAPGRSDMALFLERNRNSLALGAAALVSLCLLGLLFSPLLSDTGAGPVGPTDFLEDAEVIPDVLDPFQPEADIELSLSSRALLDGVSLPLADAKLPPSFTLRPFPSHSSLSGKYILLAVDPDAPSPENPSMKEWLHWLVVDVEADVAVIGGAEQEEAGPGKTVVPYAAPSPPSGTHRYVFVVFDQPQDMPQLDAPEERGHFNTREFSQKHSLGNPIAAMFFKTKEDNGEEKVP